MVFLKQLNEQLLVSASQIASFCECWENNTQKKMHGAFEARWKMVHEADRVWWRISVLIYLWTLLVPLKLFAYLKLKKKMKSNMVIFYWAGQHFPVLFLVLVPLNFVLFNFLFLLSRPSCCHMISSPVCRCQCCPWLFSALSPAPQESSPPAVCVCFLVHLSRLTVALSTQSLLYFSLLCQLSVQVPCFRFI